MTLPATTLAAVKVTLKVDAGSTTIDADVNALIAAVSKRAERYIGRSFEVTAQTETFDVARRTRSVFLTHCPVDLAQPVTIKNHIRRDFAATPAMSSDLYAVNASTGRVYFESYLITGPDVLQIAYTGGLSADAAALQAIVDLEYAIRRQVAHEYQRRLTPGGKAAVKSRSKGTVVAAEGEVNWLQSTKDVLNSYKIDWISTRRSNK